MLSRIIVADDEGIQRKVLSDVLKQILPETEVVACSNGEEAYAEIEQGGGEVLLTDICMPEMDGIELIEKVSENYPRIKIILISAYQEFEYARSAIRYGAVEYLIKPFRIRDAREVLERVSRSLDQEREQEQKLGHYDCILEERESVRQKDILKRLAAGYDSPAAVCPELFPELRQTGVVAVIRWKSSEGYAAGHREGLSARQQNFLEQQLRAISTDSFFLKLEQGIDKKEHRAALLLPGKAEEEAFQCLNRLEQEMKQRDILFWGGISDGHSNLLDVLSDAVKEAEDALAFCFYTPEAGRIFAYKKVEKNLDAPIKPMTVFEKELKDMLHRGAMEKLTEILERQKKVLAEGSAQNPGKVRHRISSLLVSEIKGLEGMIPQKDFDLLLNEAYERYAQCDSLDGLFDISRELLVSMCGQVRKAPDTYDAVESCVMYMKQHLEEEISLQTLADLVHFHPNYLSGQIKNKLGVSFSVYLLKLRMERAGELLATTDYKVAEVAERCGFRDGSYFNRVFRREYQMAPEQYRKVHTLCRKQ